MELIQSEKKPSRYLNNFVKIHLYKSVKYLGRQGPSLSGVIKS